MGLNKGKGGNLRKASWILKPKKRPQRGRNVHPPLLKVKTANKTAKERRDGAGAGYSVLVELPRTDSSLSKSARLDRSPGFDKNIHTPLPGLISVVF